MKYIIHRGISSKCIYENSYIGIKRALLDKDAYGVEFDIRLTKDNIIVLSHDTFINNNYIENMLYSEIIKYKYLTTLDRVLDINSNKLFVIDIKTNNNYKLFGDILIKLLNRYNKKIYLISFDRRIIKYINYNNKGIITLFPRNNRYNLLVVNYRFTCNLFLSKFKEKKIFLWGIHNGNDLEKVINKYTNICNYYIIIDKKE